MSFIITPCDGKELIIISILERKRSLSIFMKEISCLFPVRLVKLSYLGWLSFGSMFPHWLVAGWVSQLSRDVAHTQSHHQSGLLCLRVFLYKYIQHPRHLASWCFYLIFKLILIEIQKLEHHSVSSVIFTL